MGYRTRTPTSNEPSQVKNSYGGDEHMDDTALLLAGEAKKCGNCTNVTKNRFLTPIQGRLLCPTCTISATTE